MPLHGCGVPSRIQGNSRPADMSDGDRCCCFRAACAAVDSFRLMMYMSFTRKTWYFSVCVFRSLHVVCDLQSRDCVASAIAFVPTDLHPRLTYSHIGYMLPDLPSPLLSSPGKESTTSAMMHSSPSLRSSDLGASGGVVADGGKPRTRSVAAILGDSSTPFDRSSCIVTPFDKEAIRDMEFYQS
jgi:hypothetical protein